MCERVKYANPDGLLNSRFAVFHFGAAEKQAALALKPGDHVQITGIIDEWDVQIVHLTHSKLLKIGHDFFRELEAKRRNQGAKDQQR